MAIHRLPRSARKLLADVAGPGGRQLRSCLASLKPHVVHSHDVYGMMVGPLCVPRVFTVHGFIHADTQASGERFARATLGDEQPGEGELVVLGQVRRRIRGGDAALARPIRSTRR